MIFVSREQARRLVKMGVPVSDGGNPSWLLNLKPGREGNSVWETRPAAPSKRNPKQ